MRTTPRRAMPRADDGNGRDRGGYGAADTTRRGTTHGRKNVASSRMEAR
jgi:hypothetical protein